MHAYPAPAAVHLALGGAVVTLAGLALQNAAVLAWGSAVLLAVALARAAALISVSRIRAAGLEMLWETDRRSRRVVRGATLELAAELRNRDTRAARYVQLRPVASSLLEASVSPTHGDIPAGGALTLTVRVRALRVGRHAVHGLSLELLGSPGLFEVPLVFACPLGVEVLPKPFGSMLLRARGGRSRTGGETGRAGPLAGDSIDLRELRDHRPGDARKRIAWRATAKRGKLLVRDFEQDQRDEVWIVLDVSVELWAGIPGTAPLDVGIDQAASVARRHLSRGDRVGVAVVGARVRALVRPGTGARHASAVAAALAFDTGTLDADRSELDEKRVARRVAEHLRPLEPRFVPLEGLPLDRLAFRAEAALVRAPFQVAAPEAPTETERMLRRYLAAFGIESPARTDPERARTDEAMVRLLSVLATQKPRPSVVYVWSPAPDRPRPDLARAVQKLRAIGAQVRWISARHEQAIDPGSEDIARIVADAVILRSVAARTRGERILTSMGVKVERPRRDRPTHAATSRSVSAIVTGEQPTSTPAPGTMP